MGQIRRKIMRICIYGAASNQISDKYIKAVEALGAEMAKRGHGMVFGAGAHGLMGAAARGVHSAGGHVIGVIPSFFKDENIEEIYYDSDELIFTENMAQRKATMEDHADAFIIVPGGIGTFEEFFQVLTLKQLGRHNKPIALFDVDGYYRRLQDFLLYSIDEEFIKDNCVQLYGYSDTVEGVLDYIENDKGIKFNVHDVKLG